MNAPLTTPRRLAGSAPFRLAMRTLASAVTVVAVQDHEGKAVGLTATAVCSLSAEPPALIVCVNRAASIAPALRKGAEFSVNVLADDQIDVARAFGGQTPVRGAARFMIGSWRRSEQDVPLLIGALASFECRVVEAIDHGTHHVIIGEVADVHVRAPMARPLVYSDGAYGSVTQDV